MEKIRTFLKWCVALFFGSTILAVVLLRFIPVYFTPLMGIRMVEQVFRGESIRCHHKWIKLSDIPENMPLAVMASEDQRYWEHHGFDFKAIEEAIEESKAGKRHRGASTISQQTAKNVFLWPGRSWVRKGLEAYFTVLIEFIWGKERIMEVYLNSIEMGDGIYGVAAVAEHHFEKYPGELSRSDCALIAATLPKPLEYDSSHPSRYMIKRQAAILKQMKFLVKWKK